jgi:L-glyceraldehyde 3-phosphate reductase
MSAYFPDENRYQTMPYARCGQSGLKLPKISLGLWYNFGDNCALDNQRALLRRAFDLGITHLDLANNYGPPPGSAETNFGRILREDFAGLRDELVISTKAGYRMWPGPYGEFGSRKYLLASLDQSLARMGVDYVDIFYSHRPDPETPLEETMGALDSAVRSGKAIYAGLSNYNPAQTREASRILRRLGTPCLIHQPRYNMLDRRVEREGLFDALRDEGIGSIPFSPLQQGMLTGRYLEGVPPDSRGGITGQGEKWLRSGDLEKVRKLVEIAGERGQTMAQLAVTWILRLPAVTTVLIGASRISQIEEIHGAAAAAPLATEELERIESILG